MGTSNKAAANAAVLQGKKTFHGSPCYRCAGTERYVTNGSCASCVKRAVALRYEAKKARKDAGSTAV